MIQETDNILIQEDELFEHHRFVVDKGQGTIRIDKFITERIPNISRSKIQNAIAANSILVNEKPIKANYKIRPLDIITIVLNVPPNEYDVKPENISLDIKFEDEHLAIINKKAGMVVHPGLGNYTGTLLNGLLFHFNEIKQRTNNEIRPGLVHRIDKDTSGLMVIAKTELAQQHFAKLFFNHDIDRNYIALVWGNVLQDKGTITGYIDRHENDRMQFYNYQDEDKGKWAVTHYEVLERFHYVTLVKCTLETGRTHQIRVHMKYLGHPLFNDARYGGNRILAGTIFAKYKSFVENAFKICERQALHAAKIGFVHPKTNEKLLFEEKLPNDMHLVIEKWRNYTQATIKNTAI
jgi:23S rRNA pseudouridine1911/1915/1917 synthase